MTVDFKHTFVESLPDLIEPEEYARHPDGKLVRLRISVSEKGVDILGDGLRPEFIEAVLRAIGAGVSEQVPLEQMLCG